jgi:hypothetical protein
MYSPEQLYQPEISYMPSPGFLEARQGSMPTAGSFSSIVNREAEHCKQDLLGILVAK